MRRSPLARATVQRVRVLSVRHTEGHQLAERDVRVALAHHVLQGGRRLLQRPDDGVQIVARRARVHNRP